MLTDEQLQRFSRQLLLPEFDVSGQETLQERHAVIVGCGGLGNSAATFLSSSGIGRLTLIDDDRIEASNLPRQTAFRDADLGRSKATVLAAHCRALNSGTAVQALRDRWSATAAPLTDADVVLDCTDNFATRLALARHCWAVGTPLVYGAAIRFEGQLTVFDPGARDAPCYHCLFPASGNTDASCSANGVLAPIVGIIGAWQALEAIKCLCGAGQPFIGRLLVIDALNGVARTLNYRRDPGCPNHSTD